MRRRIRAGQRREWQRERRLGIRRQGFGCLFGFVFLVVVASILATLATLISQIGPLQFVIVLVVAIALLAALLRGLFGAGRDLDRLLVATRRVEDGDYAVRLGGTRSDLRPIQELAHGFDTMVARLEADEEQRRSLLADVSHELRTPLTVITGNLEAIIDGIYPADTAHLGPILDETRVLERLIDDLRTVALSEAGMLPLHPEPTDIDLLLGDVARSFWPAAEAAGVALTTDAPADLPIIDVDPVRIREVIANLVANALRHTPAGGAIAVPSGATGGSVVLTVSDTGPGSIRPCSRTSSTGSSAARRRADRAWAWPSPVAWSRPTAAGSWSPRPIRRGPRSRSSFPGRLQRTPDRRRGPDARRAPRGATLRPMFTPRGSITVITGPMFSGKTAELIRQCERARIARRKVVLIRPALDDRTEPETVRSRFGVAFPARPVPD